jgi:tetratricopeptide (TPR) repeat protein
MLLLDKGVNIEAKDKDALTALFWAAESGQEAIVKLLLEKYQKTLGRDHSATLNGMSNLGNVLHSQHKYNEAEAIYREVLAGREKVLGRDHPSTLDSMSNLGNVLSSQGKHDEAEAIYREALAHCEKVLGRDHPSTLHSMSYLGDALYRQGKHDKEEHLTRERQKRKKGTADKTQNTDNTEWMSSS